MIAMTIAVLLLILGALVVVSGVIVRTDRYQRFNFDICKPQDHDEPVGVGAVFVDRVRVG